MQVLRAVLRTAAGVMLAFILLADADAASPKKTPTPSPFVPATSIMPLSQVKPGMKGEARTVLYGDKVTSFPVEILSVMESSNRPGRLILVKASGPNIEKSGGIASGMSGSPVFINGKLVGAIGFGWEFSDHRMGLLTPIEYMADIWRYKEQLNPPVRLVPIPKPASTPISADGRDLARLATPFMADGFSPRALEELQRGLNVPLAPGGSMPSGELPVKYNPSLVPGSAIGVLLAWGDVTVGATGTLTALDNEGRFVAFAHPMLGRGAVAYPVTEAWVHGVVPSVETPFKLGTPRAIVGIATQDRPEGVGGYIGRFAPALDFSVTVKDADMKTVERKRFHIVDDPFLVKEIAPVAALGIIDDVWGRRGQGTAFVKITVKGGTLPEGWTRENMYFSPADLAKDALNEFSTLASAFAVNEFREIRPLGVEFNVELTQEPRVLYIEDVKLSSKEIYPGDSLDVTVSLRPYRKKPFTKSFTLTVPSDFTGECEVLVRGGGIAEPEQEALLDGWRSITSFEELLGELSAKESNNELVVELITGPPGTGGKDGDDLPLPPPDEEPELLSELIKKRTEEGTMRKYRSNYYVEGLLRRTLLVQGEEK